MEYFLRKVKEGSFREMEFSVPSYNFIKNRLEKSVFSHMRRKLRISTIDHVRENMCCRIKLFSNILLQSKYERG